MRCFRVVEPNFCNELALFSGTGAEKGGGRWNPKGRRAIYTAETIQIAGAEKGFYSVTQKVQLLHAELIKSSTPNSFYFDQVQPIPLCAATIRVESHVELLEITSNDQLADLLKQAGLPEHTVDEAKGSPYNLLKDKWTQKLGDFIAARTMAAGLKAPSARQDSGCVIILFPEKMKSGDLILEQVEDITLAPSLIPIARKTKVQEIRKINPYDLVLSRNGISEAISVKHFPISLAK